MNFLQKVIKIIIIIFSKNSKISFAYPKNSDLLLVDNIALDWIKEPILKDVNYTFISTRPFDQKGIYYINLKILFFFIEGLTKKLNFKTSYVYACVKCIKPKIVLENIFDYNMLYIAKHFPKIKVVILSQGMWFYLSKRGKKYIGSSFPIELGKTKNETLKNFYILLWGQKDIDIFIDHGVDKDKINLLKVGSYEASFYKEKFYTNEIKNDLLFISQIHHSFLTLDDTLRKIAIRNHIISANLILRYAKENNLNAVFLLRNKEKFDQQEINLISSLNYKGKYFKIIKNKNKAVWKELFMSKIIFSLNSTVTHDAMNLYKKTVLMPLSEKYIYKWSSNKFSSDKDFWKWTVETRDYNNFKNIVDDLIELNQKEYEKIIKDKIEYLCYSNKDKSGYKFIRNFLNKFLKKNYV